MTPKSRLVLALVLVALASGTNLLWHSFAIDEYTYMNDAVAFHAGAFSQSIDVTRFPLLPFLLSLVLDVVGNVELAGKLFSVLCGVVGVLLVYLLAKRLADEESAAWAALLTATSPVYVFLAAKVLTEPLFDVLFIAFAILVYASLERGWLLAVAGGLLGAASLARFNALMFAPLAGVFLLVKGKFFKMLPWALVAALAFSVVVAPYLLFSSGVTGDPLGLVKGFVSGQLRVDSTYYALPDRIPSNLVALPFLLGFFAPVVLLALWKFKHAWLGRELALPIIFSVGYALVFEAYALANFALLRYVAAATPFIAIIAGVFIARQAKWHGLDLRQAALVLVALNLLVGVAAVWYFGNSYGKHAAYAEAGAALPALCSGLVFSNVPTVVDHYYDGRVEHLYSRFDASATQCIFKSSFDYWGGPSDLSGYANVYDHAGITILRKS